MIKNGYVDLKLVKREANQEWKKLQLDGSKSLNIVIDWDRADLYDDNSEDEKAEINVAKNAENLAKYHESQARLSELKGLIEKHENSPLGLLAAGHMKTVYLVCLNTFLAFMWLFVVVLIMFGVLKFGFEYSQQIWIDLFKFVAPLQGLAILEVINCVFKIVSGVCLFCCLFYLRRVSLALSVSFLDEICCYFVSGLYQRYKYPN